jgi:exonuclease VII large subunit
LDPFDIATLDPKKRHLAIDSAVFMHQYVPGDVMTNHNLSFYPGTSQETLSEEEISKDGNLKFICGIVLPDDKIDPKYISYIDGGLQKTHLQVLGPSNPGLIPYDTETNLFELITTGITLTNGDVYKLPPGHIVLRSCRNLIYSKDVELYAMTPDKYREINIPSQHMLRQKSTGMPNSHATARDPSANAKKNQTGGLYSEKQLFRTNNSIKESMKKLTPLSSQLAEQATNVVRSTSTQKGGKGKPGGKQSKKNSHGPKKIVKVSRVYVTTYVRQQFDSKIWYYNTEILKQFEADGLIPKPEFEDMYPIDLRTGKYIPIDPSGTLTPRQVYAVIMSTNCMVCERNLAKLPGSSLCPKCHVVGFCAEHAGKPARVTKHDCFSPFVKVRDFDEYIKLNKELLGVSDTLRSKYEIYSSKKIELSSELNRLKDDLGGLNNKLQRLSKQDYPYEMELGKLMTSTKAKNIARVENIQKELRKSREISNPIQNEMSEKTARRRKLQYELDRLSDTYFDSVDDLHERRDELTDLIKDMLR